MAIEAIFPLNYWPVPEEIDDDVPPTPQITSFRAACPGTPIGRKRRHIEFTFEELRSRMKPRRLFFLCPDKLDDETVWLLEVSNQ